MDKSATIILNKITDKLKDILQNNLVGIYVHGSLAFDCYNPQNSDIDFIVVTEKERNFMQKKEIIQYFMHIDEYVSSKGIETSFVTKANSTKFVYPTPYYLHYSNSHKESYSANIEKHINFLQGTDKDLAAHFTVINHVGITYYGEDRETVFSPVPTEYYLDSIKYDIENAPEEITENPMYIILNLCRVLAYITDGVIISKKDGALWGIKNLPEYKNIIQSALNQYVDNYPLEYDNDKLIKFAEDMLNKINKSCYAE